MAASYDQLRAVYIYNFIKHIQWPNEANRPHWEIGLYPSQAGLETALLQISRNKKIRGKSLRITHYENLDNAGNTDLLVVGSQYKTQLRRINRAMANSLTLLVSEQASNNLHIMINFLKPEGKTLNVELHKPNIYLEGLTMGENIAQMGGAELDIAQIYRDTEIALSHAKESLQEQKKRLAQQQTLLEQQSQKLKEKTLSTENKAKELILLEGSLNKLNSELQKKQALLGSRHQQLQEEEAKLEEKVREVQSNINILDEQQLLITTQQKQIGKQDDSLKEKIATIDEQQNLLFYQQLVSASLGLIIVVALLSIYFRIKASKTLAASNKQLAETTENLRHAIEAKSLFLTTMSHEIRTPMNGVLGMADLLATTPLDEQQNRYLDIIKKSGVLLLNVINDILDFSKIEAGKMTLECLDINLSHLLYDSASVFSSQIHQNNIEFRLLIDPDLPEVVKGDPVRLSQIVTNLLGNAFKFTEPGDSIRLSANRHLKNQWSLSVRDSGKGMSEKQCKHIFDAFTQADTSITRRHGGTGLGLNICLRLVELMKGELHVESQLAVGSHFWIELPLLVSSTNADDKNSTPLHNVPILVAEKNQELRSNLCTHLQRWGCTTFEADSSNNLLIQLKQWSNNKSDNKLTLLLSDNLIKLDGEQDSILHPFNLIIIYLSTESLSTALIKKKHAVSAMLAQPVTASMIFDALAEIHSIDRHISLPEKVEQTLPHYPQSKILIAEDNNINQMVICGMLKQYQITPTVVNDGQKALEQLINNRFDLVLMDCEMPVLDGYEACERYREKEAEGEHTPIVALTAHAMKEHRDKASDSGMDAHLVKPIAHDQLKAILDLYCSPSEK
ncbi:DUF4154 domain-containing protein [bacterium AH-315-K03]|nr:DUF4154 domain-containing protein [bacterium AH-315-K03]